MGTAGVDTFDILYRQADLALFYTKAMGKNGFNLYVPELEKREFSYKPRSSASLASMESFETAEIRKLLRAISAYCPMIASANLTKNTYYMMEYTDYTAQHSDDEGTFDQLIQEGYEAFHPEDREGFRALFNRESLLDAYAKGKNTVSYVGRQIGDDGIYHIVKIVAILMEDEETGDICDISFTHVAPVEEK